MILSAGNLLNRVRREEWDEERGENFIFLLHPQTAIVIRSEGIDLTLICK
jgi:hypothetical protein